MFQDGSWILKVENRFIVGVLPDHAEALIDKIYTPSVLSVYMNYSNPVTINIKTEKKTKEEVQAIAREIGVSLNSLVNAYFKQLARTKTVTFSANEEPSDYLIKSIKKSEEDIRKGRVSPSLHTAKDAIKWLNDHA